MSLKKEKYVLVKFKLAVYIFQNKTNKQTNQSQWDKKQYVLSRGLYKKLFDG